MKSQDQQATTAPLVIVGEAATSSSVEQASSHRSIVAEAPSSAPVSKGEPSTVERQEHITLKVKFLCFICLEDDINSFVGAMCLHKPALYEYIKGRIFVGKANAHFCVQVRDDKYDMLKACICTSENHKIVCNSIEDLDHSRFLGCKTLTFGNLKLSAPCEQPMLDIVPPAVPVPIVKKPLSEAEIMHRQVKALLEHYEKGYGSLNFKASASIMLKAFQILVGEFRASCFPSITGIHFIHLDNDQVCKLSSDKIVVKLLLTLQKLMLDATAAQFPQ